MMWHESFSDIKEQNRHFGTSLLLANIGPNTAMTPKFINSSHAALLENVQIEQDIQTKLKHTSSKRTYIFETNHIDPNSLRFSQLDTLDIDISRQRCEKEHLAKISVSLGSTSPSKLG